jgi:diguanylate cyclase (GGDEF)-like protein
MEHVIEANRANDGKRAVVFFSDLDHLKQINDIFGHSDGDFAITHVADILKDTLNSSGFTGRIGGDEFVSFYVFRKNDEPKKLIAAMKEKCKILNATSYKPYYVEFSVGYVEFVCAPSIQISDLINRADEVLYEAKKKRRANVVRESPLGI